MDADKLSFLVKVVSNAVFETSRFKYLNFFIPGKALIKTGENAFGPVSPLPPTEMDVRASSLFLLWVLAASVAAPLGFPAEVQEFHEAMTKSPYNETAVVAEGVIGAGAAGPNITTDADGDIHVKSRNRTLPTKITMPRKIKNTDFVCLTLWLPSYLH